MSLIKINHQIVHETQCQPKAIFGQTYIHHLSSRRYELTLYWSEVFNNFLYLLLRDKFNAFS